MNFWLKFAIPRWHGRKAPSVRRLVLGLSCLSVIQCTPAPSTPLTLIDEFRFEPRGAGVTETFSINQESDQFLLIEVTAHGTDKRASLRGADGSVASTVRLPYLRSAPSYLCGARADTPRPIHIDIEVIQTIAAVDVAIRVFDASDDSRGGRVRERGLAALCAGLQETQGEDPLKWQPILQSLQTASELLGQANELKLARWASYFHAYFQYYPLYQYPAAIEETRHLIENPGPQKDPALQILLLQLLGQASMERDTGDSEAAAREKLAAAIDYFEQASALATTSGNDFEHVWALNNLGIAYYYQNRPEESATAHQQALEIIADAPDTYLVNTTQGNLALALEKQGQINRALGMLEEIQRRLATDGSSSEKSQNLHEQGRILIKLSRFADAIVVLLDALELAEENPQAHHLGLIQLFLGQAYGEIGNLERSNFFLNQSLPLLETARFGRALRDAWALIADNARRLRDFKLMTSARESHGAYVTNDPGKAGWYYDKAMDELAQGLTQAALVSLQESQALARATQLSWIADEARLEECVIRLEIDDPERCEPGGIEEVVGRLVAQQDPRLVINAQWLWARTLAHRGELEEAVSVTAGLIDYVETYRTALPGVLGAWFWESRSDLFRFYMDLILESEKDPLESLFALDRLLNIGIDYKRNSNPDTASNPRDLEIREALAELNEAEDENARAKAATKLEQNYIELTRQSTVIAATAAKPQDWSLINQRDPRKSLLAYYVTEEVIHIWAGTPPEIIKREVPAPRNFKFLVNSTRENLRAVNSTELEAQLSQLGRLLIEPIVDHLSADVHVLATGILAGLPIDALKVSEQFFLANHNVMNVLSLGGYSQRPETDTLDLSQASIVLAGAPILRDPTESELSGALSEIKEIAAKFPPQNRSIFAEEDLTLAAFSTTPFQNADVIHIASHATINLNHPEFSQIRLSDEYDGHTRHISPMDLANRNINAELVVLSSCTTIAAEGLTFDSALGFVSTFLSGRSTMVIASQWPVSDRATQRFFEYFYRELLNGESPMSALVGLKRARMSENVIEGISEWGAFQIYTN